MNEQMIEDVRRLNEEERALREKKFEIMRRLGVTTWEQVQSLVITHMMEVKNGHA